MKLNVFRKTSAAVMAAALALNGMTAGMYAGFTAVAADETKYEFEDAKVTGKTAVDSDDTASGGSIIYMKDDGTIEMEFEAPSAGMYDLTIYAHGVGGSKQQDLKVNGASVGTLSIPEGDTYQPIKSSVKLAKGKNTVTIVSSWGWTMFDYFTVKSTVLPDIKASQTTPCDQLATKETQSLLAYLNSVYGKNVLSGQQEIYSSGHGGNFEQEFEYLKDTTGKYPAVRGFDFLNEANILYGSEDKTTDRIIDWVNNKNGIATASWHLTVPKDFSSYKVGDKIDWGQATYSCTWDDAKTKNTATDFNTANVVKEGTKENEYYMACLKVLAEYLTKIQDANVPLIFRPLHEAEGGGGETGTWFWWGADGSKTYKEIWKLTYKTLTEDYGIHNIIWEWNSYNFDTSADWYPGDEYVDIIGYDKYSCVKYLAENNWQASYVHDAGSYASVFYGIMEKYDSKKMVALAENDSFSTVKDLTEDKAGWLYFCTWYDGGGQTDFLSDPIFNTKEDTIEMYQSDYCITLDELPEDLYKNGKDVDPSTTTTKDPAATTTTTAASSDPSGTTTTTTAAFTFKVVKKAVELRCDAMVIKIRIEGAPNASIGGSFGYSAGPTPEDWVNVEWKGNADSDGNLTVDVPLIDLPEDITSGEIQVWWSNVWDSSAKKGIDQPCEIVGYDIITDVIPETTANAEQTTTTTTASTTKKAEATTKAVETTTTATKAAETTKAPETTKAAATTTAEAAEVTLLGDANVDGYVTIADAVAILQSIGNKDKYALKPNGAANADCCDPGDGVTAKDALTIQRLDAGAITKLPEITK